MLCGIPSLYRQMMERVKWFLSGEFLLLYQVLFSLRHIGMTVRHFPRKWPPQGPRPHISLGVELFE